MIGLKWEVFIYFAVIFLREAFQALFYAVFLGLTALAQLLSLRRANSLITAFQLPKIQNFGLFS